MPTLYDKAGKPIEIPENQVLFDLPSDGPVLLVDQRFVAKRLAVRQSARIVAQRLQASFLPVNPGPNLRALDGQCRCDGYVQELSHCCTLRRLPGALPEEVLEPKCVEESFVPARVLLERKTNQFEDLACVAAFLGQLRRFAQHAGRVTQYNAGDDHCDEDLDTTMHGFFP